MIAKFYFIFNVVLSDYSLFLFLFLFILETTKEKLLIIPETIITGKKQIQIINSACKINNTTVSKFISVKVNISFET